MSERLFQCYFDAGDRTGMRALREFINLVEEADWQGLIENYDTQVNLLIALPEDEDPEIEEIFAALDHYLLDTEFHESTFSAPTGDAVFLLEFRTALSFDAELFSEFLVGMGFDRVELAVFNSQVGEFEYILDDNSPVENYGDGNWLWIPAPDDQPVD